MRTALATVLANLMLPLTSLASGPILAYTLGPTQRGQMAAVIVPTFVMMFVANMGLPEATTYAIARLRQDPRRVFFHASRIALTTGVVAAAGVWFVAPWLAHEDGSIVPLMRGIALFLPLLMLVIILRFAVNGMRAFRAVNAERVFTPLLRLGAFGVLALTGSLTVRTAALSQVVATVVGGAVLFIVLWRSRRRVIGASPADPHLTRTLASYGARGWGAVLGNLVNWRLDQLVLVALVSPAQLGYYVVAVHFAEIPQTAVNAVRNVLFAESAHREDTAMVARASRLIVLLVTCGAIVAAALSPWLVRLLFGSPFLPAVPMAVLLLAGSVPFCVEQVLSAGLLAQGHPGRRSASQIIAASFTVVGLLVLTPIMGATGAAVTSLVAYTVNCLIAVIQFRRTTGVSLRGVLVADLADFAWLRHRLSALRSRGGSRLRRPDPVAEGDQG